MKFLCKLGVLISMLLLIAGVIWFVLTSNLDNAVYPTDADSISIPLFESAIAVTVGTVLVVVSSTLRGLAYWLKRRLVPQTPLVTVLAMLVLTDLLAAAFFALWGLSWFIPHHYFISAVCWLAVVAVAYFAILDIARLRPNNSFNPAR